MRASGLSSTYQVEVRGLQGATSCKSCSLKSALIRIVTVHCNLWWGLGFRGSFEDSNSANVIDALPPAEKNLKAECSLVTPATLQKLFNPEKIKAHVKNTAEKEPSKPDRLTKPETLDLEPSPLRP